jgi:hypothetical protein
MFFGLNDVAFLGSLQPPTPLLLDLYPNAAAAYSLRQLRIGVTNVVRVRRSSDNTEADFTAVQVSDGSLAAWVGAGNNGFVQTWYDQSGNARHSTQGTNSAQPQIVTAGLLELDNGKPCARFFGAQELNTASFATAQPFTLIQLASAAQTNLTQAVIGLGQPGNSFSSFYSNVATHGITMGSAITGGTYAANVSQLKASLFNGANSAIFLNGLSSASGNTGLGSASRLTIGAVNSLFQLIGKVQEIIFYASNQTASRAGIESNINAHYAIY